jgi:two-component system, NarL family, response regulator DesR
MADPALLSRPVSDDGPIRIVIVEDNKVFREALELLLGLRTDLQVVATVADGEEAVPACKEHDPHVVLMDYRLPGLDGVEATRALKAACPEVAVVALTASANRSEMQALQDAGAVACLTKDQELEQIVAAIHRAAGRA